MDCDKKESVLLCYWYVCYCFIDRASCTKQLSQEAASRVTQLTAIVLLSHAANR